MEKIILTLAVILINFSAYCNGGSPQTPCTPTYDTIAHTICQGDTFYLGALAFTQTGSFNDTLTSAGGCDSVVTLTLTVDTAPVVTFSWRPLGSGYSGVYPGGSPVNDTMFAEWCWTAGRVQSFSMVGGNPAGGTYSGYGIVNNVFIWDSLLASHAQNPEILDTITYTYTGAGGCSASVLAYLNVLLCEGLTTIPTTNLFTLYPNPADDYTTISFDAAYTAATVFVKDITGRQLYQTQLTTSPQQIPTGNLPPGVYLVTMHSNGEVGAKLLVRE